MAMRVKVFEVTNFMGIESAIIEPGDDGLILIAGKNGAGKSSLMKAFDALLGGVKEAPRRPIRDGADCAEIACELEDKELDKAFKVTRVFTTDKKGNPKTTLKLTSKDGTLTSPQAILAKILGARMLDPLAFMRLSEKDQKEELLRLVDLGIDLRQHNLDRQVAFRLRKDANRDVKRLKTEFAAAPDPGDIPAFVDSDDLLAKLEALTAKESEKVNAQHALTQMRAEVGRKQQAIEVAEIRLTGAKNVLASADETHEAAIAEMKQRHFDELNQLAAKQAKNIRVQEEAVGDYESEVARAKDNHATFVEEGKQAAAATKLRLEVDYTEEIDKTRAAISDASTTNSARAHLEAQEVQRTRLNKDLHAAIAAAAANDNEIKRLDQLKMTSLAEANMPIEGLDIGEDCLLYGDKGLPLDQASGAAKLRVALAIAAALSPELEDIWVQDGPLLDQDSLELVRKFAVDNNLRFWLERVGLTDEGCLIIEEGILRAAA